MGGRDACARHLMQNRAMGQGGSQQTQVPKPEMERACQSRRVIGTKRARQFFTWLRSVGLCAGRIRTFRRVHQRPGIEAALASAPGRSMPALWATRYRGSQLTEMK